ncbi:hypothetical protein IMZ11_35740 [Microtetraspora sp. AC03309]|uniref:hypothetical protein n=1 Tax=Microtetraspora sp. AC03309 TaxID=2779376 RepID=UPI001E57BCB9|nr:hypothetical protein [Microtetraspora sp. AC03309]MCC5580978.1 hypothetical protein [Microtetraspora sp. AC03309]
MSKMLRSRTAGVGLTLAVALGLATAAGVAAARSGEPAPSFWSKMRSGAGESTGTYLYDSLDDLTPGAPASGAFTPAAALLEGTVVGIEPGIAFGSDDSADVAPIVGYDAPDAATRYANLVVNVDRVLAGELGLGQQNGQIRLQVEQPIQSTLADLRASIGSAGHGLFYVHNALERYQAEGRAVPQALAGYLASVHVPIGEGVFVEQAPGEPVIAPLMDNPERVDQILNGAPAPVEEPPDTASPRPPKPTDFPHGDDGDGTATDTPVPDPTDDPDASAVDVPDPVATDTAGPVESEPVVDTPTLDQLMGRAVRAACVAGTSTTLAC